MPPLMTVKFLRRSQFTFEFMFSLLNSDINSVTVAKDLPFLLLSAKIHVFQKQCFQYKMIIR